MGSTVDGLVSGLSTTDMISQLMQLEAIPQNKLKAKVTAQQATSSALQQVNTKVKTLFTAAEALTKPDAYTVSKATSSSTAVSVTASAGASTGQLTFDVTALAKAQVSTAELDADGPVTNTGKVTISINGATGIDVAIAADKNTPQGLADAINAAGLDIKAAVVNTGTATIVQFTSTKTGTANDFTIDGLVDGAGVATAPKLATPAADATIRVGGANPGAYTATSTSNTFSGLMAGVSLTVNSEQTGVTVNVSRDVGGMAGKVKAMVDAANAVIADIDLKTDVDSKTSPLKGNPLVRQLTVALGSAIAGGQQTLNGDGTTSYASFAKVGIQVDRSGRLTFDQEKFTAAYTADPAAAQALISGGAAKALKGVADGATNATTGTITKVLQSGESYEKRLGAEILNWDSRLETRKAALQRQYGNLEVALGKMKSQSSWLAGQLSAL